MRALADRTGLDRMVLIGGLTLLLVFGTAALVFSGALQKLFAPGGETVRATFVDASRLKPGAPVRVDGVAVGRVDAIRLDPGARSSTVEMTVEDDGLPVFKDARAFIRWRTALGGNYAVDLDRGSSATGELNGPIAARNTKTQVEVDQLLTAVDEDQRDGLRTTLSEVPKAFRDPKAPAEALSSLAARSGSLERGLRAVRGQDADDVERLVKQASRAVAALDDPTIPLQRLVEDAGRTLGTTASRAPEIQATLAKAAAYQPAIQTTLARLDRTLDGADPLVASASDAAPEVAPTLRRLRPVLTDADDLLKRARPLLRSLPTASRALGDVADKGTPLVDELDTSLVRLDDLILPRLAEKDPDTGRPAYTMIGSALSGLGGGAAAFDRTSRFIRLAASGGERILDTAPCKTFLTDPFVVSQNRPVVQCDTLLSTLDNVFGFRIEGSK